MIENMLVTLEIPPVSVGQTLRRIPHNMSNQTFHWTMKYKWAEAWKEAVGWQVNLNRKKFGKLPLPYAFLRIIFKTTRPFDRDNSFSASKPLVDALKGIVIVDDSPKYIDLQVEQIKIPHRREEGVLIEIKW